MSFARTPKEQSGFSAQTNRLAPSRCANAVGQVPGSGSSTLGAPKKPREILEAPKRFEPNRSGFERNSLGVNLGACKTGSAPLFAIALLLASATLLAATNSIEDDSQSLGSNAANKPTHSKRPEEWPRVEVAQNLSKLLSASAGNQSNTPQDESKLKEDSPSPESSSNTPTEATGEETTGSGEDGQPGAGGDDDDAQDCQGLSGNRAGTTERLTDLEKLVNLQACLQRRVKSKLLGSTRSGMEMFEKLSLSGGCSASLMNLMSSLLQIKSFAFKFLDASAKLPSGLMYGLLSDFGDFDQCLAIRSSPKVLPENEAEEGAYSGKYCLLSLKLNYKIRVENELVAPEGIQADGIIWDELIRQYWIRNATKGFQFGVCVPSRCTMEDLEQIYNQLAGEYNFEGNIVSCQDSLNLIDQYKPDLLQQIVIHSFYLLVALTFVGTLIDRYCAIDFYTLNEEQNEELGFVQAFEGRKCRVDRFWLFCNSLIDLQILTCFSLARNWKLFLSKGNNKKGQHQRQTSSLTESCDSLCNNLAGNKTHLHMNQATVQGFKRVERANLSKPSSSSSSSSLSQSASSDHEQGPYSSTSDDDSQAETNDNNSSCLNCLSGLKLFVIVWITGGHSFLYPSANNYQYYRSIINMNITRDSVWFAMTNFTLGIDMLLYMTGLGFVYKLAKFKSYNGSGSGKRKLKFTYKQLLSFIVKKILRFWPTYLSVIALAITVPLLSDGPMWPEMVSRRLGGACRSNWWANLLFVNNYFSTESSICLPSSWFLSVLMQCFLLGSLIMICLRKYSLKIALTIIGLLLALTSLGSFLIVYLVLEIRAPVIKMDESFVMEMDDNIFKFYTSTLSNLGPFLVGMMGGLLLLGEQVEKGRKLKFSNNEESFSESGVAPSGVEKLKDFSKSSKSLARQILIASLFVLIAIIVLSSVFYENYSKFFAASYWSLHRTGWALVTGYLIHQCATKRWLLLNDLLSLSALIPLSNLIFIAYLIHPILIYMHSGLVRDGLHVSIYNMLNIYIARLCMTFSIALLINLLVELPFNSIEELILLRWTRKLQVGKRRDLNELETREADCKEAFESKKEHPLLAAAKPVVVSLSLNDNLKSFPPPGSTNKEAI